MQINPPPIPATPSPLLVVGQPAAVGLQNGQALQATVAAIEGERLLLSIGGRTLEAHSELPLQKGQQLQLRAEVTGGRVLLRLLDPLPQTPLARLAREALPRQMPLAPLLTSLATGQSAGLPQPLQAAVRQLLESLPSPQRVATAQGLRQSIHDSGLFTESRLLRAAGDNLGGDLKANLLRLAAALRAALSALPSAPPPVRNPAPAQPPSPPLPGNVPAAARPQAESDSPAPGQPRSRTAPDPAAAPPRGEGETRAPTRGHGGAGPGAAAAARPALSEVGGALLRQVEGAVARLQLQQAAGLQRQEGEQPTWVVELPLRPGSDTPSLRLTIRDERRRQPGGEEGGWAVNLDFQTEEYGPVRAVVSLLQGEVSASFWAKHDETAALFRAQLDGLKQRLEEAGLSVARLGSYVGRQQTEEEMDLSLLPTLLDVQA